MGLFGKKIKKPEYNDVIWMKREVKVKKMLQFIKDEGLVRHVFVVSSFEETLNLLSKALEISGIQHKKIPYFSDYSSEFKICLFNANLLNDDNTSYFNGIQNPTVVFAEHYPLLEKDISILNHIDKLLNQPQIHFYLSLEDPIMQLFGSERIISLMKTMGMGEDESIEHPLISKSLSNAQEKVSKKVSSETKTDSEEAWYRMNVKG